MRGSSAASATGMALALGVGGDLGLPRLQSLAHWFIHSLNRPDRPPTSRERPTRGLVSSCGSAWVLVASRGRSTGLLEGQELAGHQQAACPGLLPLPCWHPGGTPLRGQKGPPEPGGESPRSGSPKGRDAEAPGDPHGWGGCAGAARSWEQSNAPHACSTGDPGPCGPHRPGGVCPPGQMVSSVPWTSLEPSGQSKRQNLPGCGKGRASGV